MRDRYWKRKISLFLSATLLFGLLTGIAPAVYADGGSTSPSSVIVKLSPTDDASVHSGNANTNYAAGTLILGAGRQFMMKFDLSGITDPITSATLKLYKTNTNSANFSVYRSEDDDWSESTVTYGSLTGNPPAENLIADACASNPCVASGGGGTMIPINLTNAVITEADGDKLLSLVFMRDSINATPGTDLASKEHATASWRPVLEISTLRNLTEEERVANDKARLLEQFDNTIVTDNVTLPVEGATNTVISWSSSEPAVLSSEGVVTRPAYTEADVPVTLTASLSYGNAADTADIHVTVQKQPTPSNSERVASDKQLLVEKYNNMTVYDSVYLQPVGSYGFSTITWTSELPAILSNEGEVSRPAANEHDANVTLTATIQYGEITDSVDIQMLVPKLSVRTASSEQALTAMLALAGQLPEQYAVGTAPGQVPQSAKDQLLSQIQDAEDALTSLDGDLELAIKQLREAGTAYIGSTIISDRVIDSKANTLEFSVYRQQLNALVWEAKTMLLIDPEMYTKASKEAVREEINHAEEVLNGNYQVPFVRNRAFYAPRPDEDIQFAIEHYSKASHPYSQKYGLKELIALYPDNHILAGTYNTIQLFPVDDAFVWTTEKTAPHNGSSIIYGEGRSAYMKFDLTEVSGSIKKAGLHVTNWKNDRNTTEVHYENSDDWQEDTLVYPEAGDPELGPVVSSFILGAKDVAGAGAADLTTPVNLELLGDKILTLSFSNAPGTRWASEIHSSQTALAANRPYLELSLNQVMDSKLQEKYDRIIGQASDLVEQANVGNEAWRYPEETVDGVNDSIAAAEAAKAGGNVEDIAESLVHVYDAMKDMRDSQLLRTDAEPDSTLYFSSDDLTELKTKIEQNADLADKYNEAKQLADQESLEDLIAQKLFLQDDFNYESMNEHYKLWSHSETLNFTPPAGTASIQLQFTLDAADNETGGLGHAWVDSVKISPPDTADLDIWNADFEDGSANPEHWSPTVVKGNPVMTWENREHYSNDGTRSIYMENPTSGDQGMWTSDQQIEVNSGLAYTLTFAAKIDGKLKTGVKAIITYRDVNGAAIGTAELSTNRKSMPSPPSNQNVQANALVYAITGDITYAEKTKEQIYLKLNDFLQGAEHWLVKDSRPDNIDAYGKVQGGRVASIIASAATFIKNSGVYSEEEYQDLMQKLNYFMLFLNDSRDRHEIDDYSVQLGASNWESDAVIGAAMLAMVYPELDDSKQYIANANKLIKAQLLYGVGEEGEWPESLRYHFAVLQRFGVYAKALRYQTGEDWFALPKLVKMFQYNMEVQTPAYEYTNNTINSPIFGDDLMTSGNEFSLLGVYYDEVARSNEALASQMYQTWVKAGSRLPNNGVETILLESFFTPLDFTPAYAPLELQSTDKYKDVGLVMLRNHYGTPDDTFMSIMANRKPLGHGHYDQGSFTLYAGSTPLVMDPGIESYFAGTKTWYVGSSAHATVQFKKSDNTSYLNTPTTSTEQAFTTNEQLDTMSLKVADPNSGSSGSQTRKIAYVKNGIEAFIIWDQINNASTGTIWNLPVAASELSDIDGNVVTSTGQYNMDLETTILQPANPSITQAWGRATDMVPSVDGEKKLDYIRVTNDPNQNYLTVLYPKAKGSEGLQKAEKLELGESSAEVYLLETADARQVFAAVNDSDAETIVELPSAEALINLKTGTEFPSEDGIVSVTLAASELTVLEPKEAEVDNPGDPDNSGGSNENTSGSINNGGDSTDVGVIPAGTDGNVNAEKLKTALEKAQFVQIHSKGDLAILPVSAFDPAAMADQEVEIKSAHGSFLLPLKVLPLEQLAKEWNVPLAELSVRVRIAPAKDDDAQSAAEMISSLGGEALSDVLDFSLVVESKDGKSFTIDSFGNAYVQRSIKLDDAASTSSVVVRFDPDNHSLSFVPSSMQDSEATFLRTGSSIYTVAKFNKSFEDLKGHWSESDVEQLADKLVVNGVTATEFEPDRSISRAEFAALLIRSLGISVSDESSSSFTDVDSEAWYAPVTAAAASIGMINGYTDGSFHPNATITREELAAMIIRAVSYAEGNPAAYDNSAEQTEAVLKSYKDADKLVWGQTEMAQAIRIGIVNGKSDAILAPDAQATRAEAAVMIKRFLTLVGFME
ncbi:immunoglobulin-like domain-containing protein [Paenibacillus sp. HB172176]|uniref:immunoglobulin-like domain-containing protein n=1 Tax=Paenibacillus sp. HB172176 TaxID=2493690 RepID=UPI0014389B51|nr:immunoglobulin-like domain-containing protein [Paenibacillus sp. HB172176]